MRLIDADALKAYIDAQKGRPFIGCTVGEALKIMTDEQPTVTPEPHWIPVTERLPEVGESVLICDAYGDICIGHRTRSGYYFPDFCEDKIKDVRAWAELPEPYKGGDGW